jgi:hypothetical protein
VLVGPAGDQRLRLRSSGGLYPSYRCRGSDVGFSPGELRLFDSDLGGRREEMLTTRRTSKLEFHRHVDEIMAGSFTVWQSKTCAFILRLLFGSGCGMSSNTVLTHWFCWPAGQISAGAPCLAPVNGVPTRRPREAFTATISMPRAGRPEAVSAQRRHYQSGKATLA